MPLIQPITRSPLSPLARGVGEGVGGVYQNLLTYTEQFDTAAWVKTNVTVNADATTAPDGATSADKVVETAVSGVHKLNQIGVLNTAGALHELVCHFKSAERTRGQVILQDGSFNGVVTNFDLSAGTVTTATAAGSGWSAPAASITALAGGWYRVRLSGVSSAAATLRADLLMQDASGVTSYLGVAGSGMYYWGAMITRGAGLPYKARLA